MASFPTRAWLHPPPLGGPTLATRGREALLGRLLALLELRPDDLLVQLGCAFPDHLLALTKLVPLRYQALVVDPSPERLAPFAGKPALRSVRMDALRFSVYPMQCDRILLEDALLRGGPGRELARGLFARLDPAGRLLAFGVEPRPALPPRGASLGPAAPLRSPAEDVVRVLEGAGFEVRRDAAPLGNGSIHLFLGVKAAAS